MSRKKPGIHLTRGARDESAAHCRPGVPADTPSREAGAGGGAAHIPTSPDVDEGIRGALRASIVEAAADASVDTSVNAILDARDADREAGVEAAMRALADRSKTPIGVDGCKQGWLAVVGALPSCTLEVHERFESILLRHPDALVVVDIPIGLIDGAEGRRVDTLMRKRLGERRSSVFTAPGRATLHAADYEDAKKRNLEATGKSLSKQAWNLVPKIREVDSLMRPSLQERVRESHPEVAFASMSGKPMEHPKKTPAGISERRHALRGEGYDLDHLEACLPPRSKAGMDDLLDACVLHDVACRILDGTARALPETGGRDSEGLLMQVWHAPR